MPPAPTPKKNRIKEKAKYLKTITLAELEDFRPWDNPKNRQCFQPLFEGEAASVTARVRLFILETFRLAYMRETEGAKKISVPKLTAKNKGSFVMQIKVANEYLEASRVKVEAMEDSAEKDIMLWKLDAVEEWMEQWA